MIYLLISFLLSVCLTTAVRSYALKYRVVDNPDAERKLHAGPVPLLGGLAIFIAFWLAFFILTLFSDLKFKGLQLEKLYGVFFGSLILVVMGWIDDKKQISSQVRLLVSALAIILVILGGVNLTSITNPQGGTLNFVKWALDFPVVGATNMVGGIVVFAWLFGMMYTTKILDGLDGLSTGVTAVGTLVIFLLSSTTKFYQADVRMVSLILLGACLGFLVFNFHPAKIFLGEGGSLFLGFILGVLAVIAGGKIATALLVMGIPILDLSRVIYVRMRRKQSIFKGDREHLHFRLVDSGVSHRLVVILMYLGAFAFGITTLFLPSMWKLAMLGVLVIIMMMIERKLTKYVLLKQKN